MTHWIANYGLYSIKDDGRGCERDVCFKCIDIREETNNSWIPENYWEFVDEERNLEATTYNAEYDPQLAARMPHP